MAKIKRSKFGRPAIGAVTKTLTVQAVVTPDELRLLRERAARFAGGSVSRLIREEYFEKILQGENRDKAFTAKESHQ